MKKKHSILLLTAFSVIAVFVSITNLDPASKHLLSDSQMDNMYGGHPSNCKICKTFFGSPFSCLKFQGILCELKGYGPYNYYCEGEAATGCDQDDRGCDTGTSYCQDLEDHDSCMNEYTIYDCIVSYEGGAHCEVDEESGETYSCDYLSMDSCDDGHG